MQALLGFVIVFGAWNAMAHHLKKQGAGRFRRHLAGFGVAFISLCVYVSFNDHSATLAEAEASKDARALATLKAAPLFVTAPLLFYAYGANEVAADRKYNGKVMAISGTVQNVEKDGYKFIVHLRTANPLLPVASYLDSFHESEVAQMRKGEVVAFICMGNGMVAGRPVLRECQLSP